MTNAQESVHQVFRDLMPTLNLHAGANKRLVDLPNLSSSDVTFSADSFFNIPGVVSFSARLYITESHPTPFGFRDNLGRDNQRIAVLQRDRRARQRFENYLCEIIPRLDQGNARQCS